MIERSHLKIIRALADNGSLTAAANALCLTQPALSHQIRYLEHKAGVTLWERQGRRLKLTRAGEMLLGVARQVLPVLEQAEKTMKAYGDGREGVLRIGVECHPCYEWLKGMLAEYLVAMPGIDVDLVHKFQFSGLEGLLNQHIDVLVTPDAISRSELVYAPLFDYELVLMMAADHGLAGRECINAGELAHETLLTFPVPQERLDVYSQFLRPAGVSPRQSTMESLDIMIQMVALGRGLTVLPDWLAHSYRYQLPVATARLGEHGVMKTLFAAVRQGDRAVPYIDRFIQIGQRHHPK